jgi:hypothetical protein
MLKPSPIKQLSPQLTPAYAHAQGEVQHAAATLAGLPAPLTPRVLPAPKAPALLHKPFEFETTWAPEHSPTLSATAPPYGARPYAYIEANDALLQSLKALPAAIGVAVNQANAPMKELLLMAKDVVADRKQTRMQSIATAINRWALPVVQVLLGAAVLAVGVTTMEISIMVIGATMTATGLALCVTLLAGMLAPHPLDAVKEFLHRKHKPDPEYYEPGMQVALDAGA